MHCRSGGEGGCEQRGGLVNIKSFYVASLSSALDLDIATPDDILVHATPDVLADHLPRPLWARLLTACVGAPKVDAQLVVETIGVPNLCEHVPPAIVWNCLASLAQRSLGGEAAAPAPYVRSDSQPIRAPLIAAPPPPPETPAPERATAVGPSIPSLADVGDVDTDDRPSSLPSRTRQPTSQRFRQSSGTGIGRLATARRPQAAAPTTPIATEVPRGRRNGEYDVETDVSTAQAREDWKANLAVEDEQLVDWTSSDETVTGSDDLNRKR